MFLNDHLVSLGVILRNMYIILSIQLCIISSTNNIAIIIIVATTTTTTAAAAATTTSAVAVATTTRPTICKLLYQMIL